MNSREYFGVGARLLGIYSLIQGFASLPGIVATYEVASAGGTSSPIIYTLAIALQSVFLIAAGLLLVCRYRGSISAPPLLPLSTTTALSVGLALLGIYFLVSGTATVLANVGQSLIVQSSWDFLFSSIASGVLYAAAGAALTLRASFIANRLMQMMPPD